MQPLLIYAIEDMKSIPVLKVGKGFFLVLKSWKGILSIVVYRGFNVV